MLESLPQNLNFSLRSSTLILWEGFEDMKRQDISLNGPPMNVTAWGCDLRWHGRCEEMAEDVSVEMLGEFEDIFDPTKPQNYTETWIVWREEPFWSYLD